jgi:hypothetical protein
LTSEASASLGGLNRNKEYSHTGAQHTETCYARRSQKNEDGGVDAEEMEKKAELQEVDVIYHSKFNYCFEIQRRIQS